MHIQSKADKEAQSRPIALFVSDVHLQPTLPKTTEAFLTFLREHAVEVRQLYLLGDLFEYWAGDDDVSSPYHQSIIGTIRAVAENGVKIFWIAGNRDFLVGQKFAKAAGITFLAEPSIIDINDQRIVLMHGDAQCTDDQAYMDFRAQVRAPAWQENFLALPLAQRKAMIDGMRTGSREAQRSKSYDIMDVNADAIASLFKTTDATLMIHGHTHRPAVHHHEVDGKRRIRHVLPDWDCDAVSPRGGWLALYEDASLQRFRFDGAVQ